MSTENKKLIPSFQVDHTKIKPGIYVSRVDEIGKEFVTTFDVRMKRPNVENYITPKAMHTIEHVVATFLRNDEKEKDKIVYWGPMGCLTGCYLIVKGKADPKDIYPLVLRAFKYLADYSGEVPGATPVNCGNYSLHDLESAKKEAKKYVEILEKEPCFSYPVEERIKTDKGEVFFDS